MPNSNHLYSHLAMLAVLWASLIVSNPALAEIELQADCDANGKIVKQFKETDPARCLAACKDDALCEGFTHISNWNECFLKNVVKNLPKVRMYSGVLSEENPRKVAQEGLRLDNKGKDWQKKILKDHDACRDLCLTLSECRGFTFIEGYDVCWLKKTKGLLVEKTFSCGTKKLK